VSDKRDYDFERVLLESVRDYVVRCDFWTIFNSSSG